MVVREQLMALISKICLFAFQPKCPTAVEEKEVKDEDVEI